MAKVIAYTDKTTGEKESIESLLRRFKKKVLEDNIMYECKKREFYVKPTLARKLKAEEAMKRNKRRASKNRKNKK